MTKQQLIECPNCQKFTPFVVQHRHLENEVIELGLSCQHCQRWSHTGYFNQELLSRQEQLTNRRKQRAFKRDFDKFQIEAEKRLANESEPAQLS